MKGKLGCVVGFIVTVLMIAMMAAMCSMVCGCVNAYTRSPRTPHKIESIYQSTSMAASCTLVCSFPQVMSDNPKDGGFKWWNVFTLLVGLPMAVDTVCEAAIDTVLLPVDYLLAKERREK